MKVLLSAVLLLLLSSGARAQQQIRSIALTDTVLHAAIDRPGDFYIVTKSGQIQRFDKDGNLDLLFKGDEPPTLFDPRDGARLFAYYRNDQHYEFRSPSFDVMKAYKIDESFAIQPWLICPSGEYKLWILDKADQSLKKVDIKASEVEVEVIVDPSLIRTAEAFTAMRDYQTFVFLLDPSRGILVFNTLGKHLRTLDAPGISAFNFLGEELYYVKGGHLEFFNLFTAETRKVNIQPGYIQALLTDERMILIARERIDIFPFGP